MAPELVPRPFLDQRSTGAGLEPAGGARSRNPSQTKRLRPAYSP